MAQPSGPIELLICTKCRRGDDTPEDGERPGATLFANLADVPLGDVTITPVECLSNCTQGCTIALRGPGRWTYVYGRFDPEKDVAVVADGVAKYAATADGLVPWRERPEHFRKNCIARVPPLAPPIPSFGDT